MTKMIFLAGGAGAGKDTAAKVFTDRGWRNMKLAGPLKAMLATLLTLRGVSDREINRMLEGDMKTSPHACLENHTPRHAMQTLGTEWGREKLGPTLWLRAFEDMVHVVTRDLATAPAGIIVTDVRFLNEAQFLMGRFGAEGYYVHRPSNNAPWGEHTSEDLRWASVMPRLLNAHESAEAFQEAVAKRFFPEPEMIRQGIG